MVGVFGSPIVLPVLVPGVPLPAACGGATAGSPEPHAAGDAGYPVAVEDDVGRRKKKMGSRPDGIGPGSFIHDAIGGMGGETAPEQGAPPPVCSSLTAIMGDRAAEENAYLIGRPGAGKGLRRFAGAVHPGATGGETR